MRKLRRMTIDALQDNFPVLNEEDQRGVLGGGEDADCLFKSIANATGYSISTIEDTFAGYLQNKYSFISSGQQAHDFMDTFGVHSSDAGWLLNEFGLSKSAYLYNTGSYGVMIIDGHAVNFLYADASGNFHYYDVQNKKFGSIPQSQSYGVFRSNGGSDSNSDNSNSAYQYGSNPMGNNSSDSSSYSYNSGENNSYGSSSYGYDSYGSSSYGYNSYGSSSYSY